MSRTKEELATENRQLRRLVGEVYDRVADYIEPERHEDEDDIDEGNEDDIDDEAEDDEE